YGPFSLSYSYTYYANGLKKSFTGPNGVPIDYSYDENNRLAGIGVPGEGQISYAFDAAHWNSPATSMLPGGSKTEYAYDPLMRIETLTAKDPAGNTLLSRDHTYSPAGNMVANATEHGNYTYQYDKLHQLTQAVNPALTDEAYTYDPNGNRLTDWRVTGTWNYNANNELQSFAATTFNFDANGNTTHKTVDSDSTHYIYDIEDRLVRVENSFGAAIADYYYDPFGRRLWKEVDGTRTYFLYSDEGLIGEYDVLGAETKSYGYVPDSSFSTDPLFVKTGGTYYWYQNDHLGTPQKIIRTNGQVVWDAVYDSFGNILINTESINSNLRMPGQYFDAETGLYYNWNRYYDPKIGRYLRTDPFGDGLNLYAYCQNDPINFMDPMGLCAVRDHVHDLLALAGMVPALGIIPDLIDVGLYVLEGDYSNASFAGLAAVPILGDAARLGQYGRKGFKYVSKSAMHSPMNPGPLAADIANTFRSGTYTARTLDKPTTLYRVIGDTGNPAGSYWSRAKPQGPLQSVIDSALDQNWGNTATHVVEAKIPAGTRIYEGAAAAQRGLVGGGNQIYIPRVNQNWIAP
ncbi:MAG: RHS repeat-associated core domain-containing protein, partial [Pseudomonadota bacterium]